MESSSSPPLPFLVFERFKPPAPPPAPTPPSPREKPPPGGGAAVVALASSESPAEIQRRRRPGAAAATPAGGVDPREGRRVQPERRDARRRRREESKSRRRRRRRRRGECECPRARPWMKRAEANASRVAGHRGTRGSEGNNRERVRGRRVARVPRDDAPSRARGFVVVVVVAAVVAVVVIGLGCARNVGAALVARRRWFRSRSREAYASDGGSFVRALALSRDAGGGDAVVRGGVFLEDADGGLSRSRGCVARGLVRTGGRRCGAWRSGGAERGGRRRHGFRPRDAASPRRGGWGGRHRARLDRETRRATATLADGRAARPPTGRLRARGPAPSSPPRWRCQSLDGEKWEPLTRVVPGERRHHVAQVTTDRALDGLHRHVHRPRRDPATRRAPRRSI